MCSYEIKICFTGVLVDKIIKICLNELYSSDFIAPLIPKCVCLSLLNMALKNDNLSFYFYIYRQIC